MPLNSQKHISAANATDLIQQVWALVIKYGEDKLPVSEGNETSFRGKRPYKDLSFLNATLTDPTQLLLWNPRYLEWPSEIESRWCPRLVMANVRFIMLVAGNESPAPFLFYEPRLKSIVDKYGKLPSMDYGARLRHWKYDKGSQLVELDQLEQAIKRLRKDPTDRKVILMFYKPEDLDLDENNTACISQISFNIGNDGLEAEIVMRSNSVYQLLPNNLYEFGLLLQLIAIEVGVPLRTLHYNGTSCHIYLQELSEAEKTLAAADAQFITRTPAIPGKSPLQQMEQVVRLEREIRENAHLLTSSNAHGIAIFDYYIHCLSASLDAFWRQFYYPILLYISYQNRFSYGVRRLYHLIEAPWNQHLPSALFDTPALNFKESSLKQRSLLPEISEPHPLDTLHLSQQEILLHMAMQALNIRVNEADQAYALRGGAKVSQEEFSLLRRQFIEPLLYGDAVVSNQLEHLLSLFALNKIMGAVDARRQN